MPGKVIQRVRFNIQKAVKDIAGRRTENAVYAYLKAGADFSMTMTPVDTSNLINSLHAPQIQHRRRKTVGRVGYTANYAAAVHNAPGTLKGQPRADFGRTSNHSEAGPMRSVTFGGGTGKGNYWDPNAEPGFLTKGFEAVEPRMLEILLAAYKA
jgi:hypothetical protein